jgi:hypothetical protein
MAKQQPRGIRRNNPGNIEWGDPWQGLANKADYPADRFAAFVSPVYGIRALARTLITYYDKRRANDGSKIDSLQEIVERWAPAADNNDVDAYARQLAALLPGIGPKDETLDLHDPAQLRAVVEGIILHENGRGPLKTPNTWYPADVIDEALRRAGVVAKPTATGTAVKAATPVAIGAVGVDQLAEAAPHVIKAINDSHADLTSGNVSQIILGVAVLSLSVVMIYRQWRSAQLGIES